MQNKNFIKFGLVLIVIGIVGFIVSVFISSQLPENLSGALPAVSFLIMMVGFAFSFPTMLEESKGQISTMRIIVFAVTMVFCVIYIKMGWNMSSIDGMKIDSKWVYILGLAFGSKVAQKYGEEDDDANDGKKKDEKKDD